METSPSGPWTMRGCRVTLGYSKEVHQHDLLRPKRLLETFQVMCKSPSPQFWKKKGDGLKFFFFFFLFLFLYNWKIFRTTDKTFPVHTMWCISSLWPTPYRVLNLLGTDRENELITLWHTGRDKTKDLKMIENFFIYTSATTKSTGIRPLAPFVSRSFRPPVKKK